MLIKNLLRIFFTLTALQLLSQIVIAQEVLVNLNSYPIKDNTPEFKLRNAESLQLPFFDDFSKIVAFPSSNLWLNSGVVTNLNYSISTPTIGSATFDAATSNGELYSYLSSVPQLADALTSQPINLNLPGSDSIYLSFQFQPQGLGYAPSTKDSLVLDFCDSLNQWHRIWASSVNFTDSTLTQSFHTSGKSTVTKSNTLNSTFHSVIIPITDAKFLHGNFQFRFRNYASAPKNQDIPGMLSNCDHWMLDLVYLNRNRTYNDTTFNDIAYCKPINTLMNNYKSIPWSHFTHAYSNEFSEPLEFTITYFNLGFTTWNVTRRFSIIDKSGLNQNYNFSGGAENIFALQEIEYTRNFEYNFSSAWDDSAKFILQSYLITDDNTNTLHLRSNDTINSELNFFNYYAYDDGSAESGYGIFGEGTSNGMVACKFNNYKADSIQGVMVYFNRTINDGNQTSFKLTVWDDNNEKPGNIIAQRVGVRTLYTDSLNQFTIYRIPSTYIPEGTFYIGWAQVYECMMNVGFDLNNNNQNKLFLNIGNGWTNTNFKGTLMIRPIMNNMYQWPTDITCSNITQESFNLYPNPANSLINIKLADNQVPKFVQVIGSTGRILLQTTQHQNINIQSFPNGIYIVRVGLDSGEIITKKLIIRK